MCSFCGWHQVSFTRTWILRSCFHSKCEIKFQNNARLQVGGLYTGTQTTRPNSCDCSTHEPFGKKHTTEIEVASHRSARFHRGSWEILWLFLFQLLPYCFPITYGDIRFGEPRVIHSIGCGPGASCDGRKVGAGTDTQWSQYPGHVYRKTFKVHFSI